MRRYCLYFCLCFLPWMTLGMAKPPEKEVKTPHSDLEAFVRQDCPHCERAKGFLVKLKKRFPEATITIHDIGQDPSALLRLKTLAAKFGIRQVGVPTFLVGEELVVGFESEERTGKHLEALLGRPPPKEVSQRKGLCPIEADLTCEPHESGRLDGLQGISLPFFGYRTLPELSLPAFTLLLGLLDGFNPCAMWVLLFLLALLTNLRDRRKMFLLAGTFVLVSGAVYFAFMAAWLNIFFVIGNMRMIQVMIGIVAAGVGLINVKDFWALGQGVSLAIPESAKTGVYARVRQILTAEHLGGALVGILILALSVNMIEFVCTAGFPALFTQVLSQQGLDSWEYYGYLGLYNLAYVADDAVMVTIAVVTLSHHKLQEREGRWLKLVSGLVMLGLGLLLLFAPGLLL